MENEAEQELNSDIRDSVEEEIAKSELPTTHEEVLQNLAKHPEAVSKNEVERMANEAGVDFDSREPKDEFNRNNLE